MADTTYPGRPNPHAVPLRAAPDAPDGDDPKRVALVAGRWTAQDAACQARDRMVEEHTRMLAGRQWDVWSDVEGRFVDPTVYLEPDERRFRQRPTIDYLRRGFRLNIAKLTESPPVIAFQPATADRTDAMLAEVADTLCKTLAQQARMDALRPIYMGWAWATGTAFLKSRAVYDGEEQPVVGPALLNGAQGEEVVAPAVPYDAQGNPLARLVGAMGGAEGEVVGDDPQGLGALLDESTDPADLPRAAGAPGDAPEPSPYGDVPAEYGFGEYGYEVTGEAATRRKARIVVDVLAAPEVRREWRDGPIEEARWVIHRTYLTRTQVEERYGVVLDEDATPSAKGGAGGEGLGAGGKGGGVLERIRFGSGHFGAATQKMGGETTRGISAAKEAGDTLVAVDEMWEKPCPDYPTGRLLVVLPHLRRVLLDGPRPFPKLAGAGPFREVPCDQIPGRMFPSCPMEMAAPLQKALNRVAAHMMEHAAKCSDPVRVVDPSRGVEPSDWTNQRGLILTGDLSTGSPIAFVSPAALGREVAEMRDWLREELMDVLNLAGSEGKAPTSDSSGELIEQLRYNSDRPVSALAHSAVRAEAGLAEDWLAILPTIWTDAEIISAAGEDGTLRTVTVRPELFETGRVHVVPVMESMLPESRGERQARVLRDYQLGVFGQPGAPDAVRKYMDLMRYPHNGRSLEPGGVDRATAKRHLGRLVQGTPAAELVLLETYDYAVHLDVVRGFTASPEFLEYDPAVQEQVMLHYQLLRGAAVAAQMQQQQLAGAVQSALVVQAGQQAALTQRMMPAPATPDGAPGADGTAGTNAPTPAQSGQQHAPPSADGRPPFVQSPGAPT